MEKVHENDLIIFKDEYTMPVPGSPPSPWLVLTTALMLIGLNLLLNYLMNSGSILELVFSVTILMVGLFVMKSSLGNSQEDEKSRFDHLRTQRRIIINLTHKTMLIKSSGWHHHIAKSFDLHKLKKIELEKQDFLSGWGIIFIFHEDVEKLTYYKKKDCRKIQDTIREILRNYEDNPANV